MMGRVVPCAVYSGGLFTLLDAPEPGNFVLEEQLAKKYGDRQSLSWRERLGLMWRRDQMGNLSPELQEVATSTQLAAFAGVAIGAVAAGSESYRDFIRDNKHTAFRNPQEAQRTVRGLMMFSSFKTGVRTGALLSSMVFCYTAATQSCNVVRNDIAVLDHAAVGAGLGSLYRLLSGPKAMVSSMIIGGILGALEGSLVKIIMLLTGFTIETRFQKAYEHQDNLNKLKIDTSSKSSETIRYTNVVGEAGEDSVSEPESRSSIATRVRKFIYGPPSDESRF